MCFQELLVKGAKKLGKSDIYKNHPSRPTACIGNFSQLILEFVITNFSGILIFICVVKLPPSQKLSQEKTTFYNLY